MIHMPHRSVTRFFVPMIDVLLLLFCIFLLMPLADEAERDKQNEQSYQNALDAESSDYQREQIQRSLEDYMKASPESVDNAKLFAENAALKKALDANPQQRYGFQLIDVDKETGELSYYDAKLPESMARVPIPNEKAARLLIERHRKEAAATGETRKLYYFFLLPRPYQGAPDRGQLNNYKKWFASVASSLQ